MMALVSLLLPLLVEEMVATWVTQSVSQVPLVVPDAPKQFACKLNILGQANCARERQHLVRNRITSTGLSRGRKHPKTILLLHSLHFVARSLKG